MLFSVLSLGFLSLTSAVVLPRQGAITPLSSTQIDAFTPYTFFASAAYCNPSTTVNWSCGASCNANPGFVPVASGGDGSLTQFWYVGFDPDLNTVVVGHQGTNPTKIVADLTDADFFLTDLDQTMFPGTSGLQVHNGFGASQARYTSTITRLEPVHFEELIIATRSAPSVLAATQQALLVHGTNSVTIVGHSLGAAIALIDAVYLPLRLPSTTTFKLVGYSMPRVGNLAFAAYLDTHFPDLTYITNKEDVVPILPGEFLGFHHPHGEIHIDDSGVWDACVGDDNNSKSCSTGDVPTIFQGNTNDHDGPFNGIIMGQGC